jgi:hypothetical protein
MKTPWQALTPLVVLLFTAPVSAQDQPAPTPTPAPQEAAAPEKPAAEPFHPPEGNVIINLPSAQVFAPKTLQIYFTHRFSQALNSPDTNIHNLFSFDSGADVGIGMSYVPVKDLDLFLLRNRILEDYEFSAKYRFLHTPQSPVEAALRAGFDARTASTPSICETEPRPPGCSFADHKWTFFAQAIGSVTLFERLRLTAIPTYVSYSAQTPFVVTESVHSDVFNVPFAIAVEVTHSINVQAEVVPARSSANSPGVGWILAVEKTLLRHRFSFTVGNLRPTTVDQYIGADFRGSPGDYYIGFNINRQWKL